jgi:hypothetical protein
MLLAVIQFRLTPGHCFAYLVSSIQIMPPAIPNPTPLHHLLACLHCPLLQIMQYGLMSKLSTGYALLDAFLVMLVPLMVNRLLPQLQTFVQNLFNRPAPPEQTHERIIIHKQNPNRNWWYSSDDDEHPNHKLQQAIIVHLNTLPDLFSQLESCDVQLCKAKRKPAAAAADSSEEVSGGADGSSVTSTDDEWYPGVCAVLYISSSQVC